MLVCFIILHPHLRSSNYTSPKDSSTLGHLQWIVRHSCTAAWSRSRCHSEGQRRSHACSRCCCQRTLEHPCCSHGARGRRCTLNWTLQMYLCLFIYQVFSLHLLYFGWICLFPPLIFLSLDPGASWPSADRYNLSSYWTSDNSVTRCMCCEKGVFSFFSRRYEHIYIYACIVV